MRGDSGLGGYVAVTLVWRVRSWLLGSWCAVVQAGGLRVCDLGFGGGCLRCFDHDFC